jgi:1-acyl-sn-glycerol-3-phosphate acyltransferase
MTTEPRRCMPIAPWLYQLVWRLSNAVIWLATGWQVVGREHVPPAGPLLVVCNHLNNADPYLLSAAVTRPICWLAKIELFRVPVLGWILRQFGAFPIDRGAADRQAIKTALALVAAGCVVGVFPEGTRSRTYHMTPGLRGAGLLVARSGATILPVAITGSERALRLWPRPTVRVRIGPAIQLGGERAGGRDYQAIVDSIMIEIARLLPPDYRGTYRERAQDRASTGP